MTELIRRAAEVAMRCNGRVNLGINNVFDRDPPISVTATNSFGAEYEIPGRFPYMRYEQTF